MGQNEQKLTKMGKNGLKQANTDKNRKKTGKNGQDTGKNKQKNGQKRAKTFKNWQKC